MLLPYGTYSDSADSEVLKDLTVQADALENCQDNADALLSECYPDETVQLLPDWESTYGITNDSSISYPARIDNLLAAINARGSLTKDYFITLAAKLGYTVTIEEFLPFMAGWNEAGDEIWIEDIIYVWEVVVSNSNAVSYYFEAGISCSGDSLNYFSDAYLEGIFNRLKPAHAAVSFNYQ